MTDPEYLDCQVLDVLREHEPIKAAAIKWRVRVTMERLYVALVRLEGAGLARTRIEYSNGSKTGVAVWETA